MQRQFVVFREQSVFRYTFYPKSVRVELFSKGFWKFVGYTTNKNALDIAEKEKTYNLWQ